MSVRTDTQESYVAFVTALIERKQETLEGIIASHESWWRRSQTGGTELADEIFFLHRLLGDLRRGASVCIPELPSTDLLRTITENAETNRELIQSIIACAIGWGNRYRAFHGLILEDRAGNEPTWAAGVKLYSGLVEEVIQFGAKDLRWRYGISQEEKRDG